MQTFLLVLIAIVMLSMRADFLLVVVSSFVITIWGLASLVGQSAIPRDAVINYVIVSMAFVLGWFASVRASNRIRQKSPRRNVPAVDDEAVQMWTLVPIVLLVGYHFYKSGIPLFSPSIETSRFDVTASGLLGIPGRMYLFGIPIAWSWATVSAKKRGIRARDSRAWILATIVYFVVSIFSGYKSGLVGFLTNVIVVQSICHAPARRLFVLLRKYWYAPLAALGYAVYTAVRYQSVQDSDQSVLQQFVTRMTVSGIEPKALLLSGDLPRAPFQWLKEIEYYLLKYSGNSTGDLSVTEKTVSAAIYGTPSGDASWLPPVTIGGIPELIFLFGVPVAVIICFILGFAVASFPRLVERGSIPLGSFLASGAIFISYWLSRGNAAYYSINFLVVFVMYLVIRRVARIPAGGLRALRMEASEQMVIPQEGAAR